MSYNSKYTGQQVEDAIDKVQELNASFADVGGEAEEPELPWVLYTDGVVGDINTILDNINGEEA